MTAGRGRRAELFTARTVTRMTSGAPHRLHQRPDLRNRWRRPRRRGCRSGRTGARSPRACTGTGRCPARTPGRRSPAGSSHTAGSRRCPRDGSGCPGDQRTSQPHSSSAQHFFETFTLFSKFLARSHLAATLSARLVAVKIEALVCLTVAGAAGLVTPLASGTREVCPVDTHTHMHVLGQTTVFNG